MQIHPESKELLRETLEKYVKDLAEELLYWVEELNKLDTAESSPAEALPRETPVPAHPEPWTPRRGRSHSGGQPAHSSGK